MRHSKRTVTLLMLFCAVLVPLCAAAGSPENPRIRTARKATASDGPPGSMADVEVEEKRLVEMDVETLLAKIRQAQVPTQNMVMEWETEHFPPFGIPTKRNYTAFISGNRARLECVQESYETRIGAAQNRPTVRKARAAEQVDWSEWEMIMAENTDDAPPDKSVSESRGPEQPDSVATVGGYGGGGFGGVGPPVPDKETDSEDSNTPAMRYGGYYGGYGGIPPEEREDPNSPDDNSPENRP